MESTNDRTYQNEEIRVFWKPGLCIHSQICWKNLIEVFNPRKRPWVDLEGAQSEKIAETVNQCPSAALSFEWINPERNAKEKATQPITAAPLPEVSIRIQKGGPFEVKGLVKLMDDDGNEIPGRPFLFLCRCGASKSMPFCDGNHRNIGFKG